MVISFLEEVSPKMNIKTREDIIVRAGAHLFAVQWTLSSFLIAFHTIHAGPDTLQTDVRHLQNTAPLWIHLGNFADFPIMYFKLY